MKEIKSDISKVGIQLRLGCNGRTAPRSSAAPMMMRVPPKSQIFDGHCVILVGYEDDDAVLGGGSFLFRNSWGADWADGGYAKMPFALLDFCINDAYSIRKITPIKKNDVGSVETSDCCITQKL